MILCLPVRDCLWVIKPPLVITLALRPFTIYLVYNQDVIIIIVLITYTSINHLNVGEYIQLFTYEGIKIFSVLSFYESDLFLGGKVCKLFVVSTEATRIAPRRITYPTVKYAHRDIVDLVSLFIFYLSFVKVCFTLVNNRSIGLDILKTHCYYYLDVYVTR